ncbi:MAG: hypothetical protein KatS3mg016_1314 [Fimbriimonadales bacterium]|nr:MAG: hypothetical protein KatS3mg016_1314 [Fimbriimonadales bacterium]
MLEFLIYWIACAVCVAVTAVLVGYWQQRAITLLATTETPPTSSEVSTVSCLLGGHVSYCLFYYPIYL